ncbi:MAG: hypothetical protein E7583_03095 [Ruminococcaceae bacterium]|nr:hypothetical protein [Oscillospiraceae bacterium]
MEFGVKEVESASVKIGSEEVKKAYEVLTKYKAGKVNLEKHIIENERWFKMRQWEFLRKKDDVSPEPSSAWLFNVIINKHADCMDNFPCPNVLPREEGDRPDARTLSAIIPVILERREFEQVYSDNSWYKLKNGACVYGVFWENSLEKGLGDIDVRRVELLNLFWEPGIRDVQKSRNLFSVEVYDEDVLKSRYPKLEGKLGGGALGFDLAEYRHDESIDNSGKSVVIDWYYKKVVGSREVVHYCKFVGETVLYASENDPNYAERGYYDHGMYPFVFDVLFPNEDSPCGFGYVDLAKNPQMYIDKINRAMLDNTMMSATPRWLVKKDSAINKEVFLDFTNQMIEVEGSLDEAHVRQLDVAPLPGAVLSVLQYKIDELKETSGNTSYAQGMGGSVTTTSGIAALQEAAGKLSRDMVKSSYRAYSNICYMVLELIRQFYDETRSFRITGSGKEEFISYDNSNIRLSESMGADGRMYSREPVFDIKISAEKQNSYQRNAQNELAVSLLNLGVFDPARVDMTLPMLELMTFDGKEKLVDTLSKNATLQDKMMQMVQLCVNAANSVGGEFGMALMQQVQALVGNATPGMMPSAPVSAEKGVNLDPVPENRYVEKAREMTAKTTEV